MYGERKIRLSQNHSYEETENRTKKEACQGRDGAHQVVKKHGHVTYFAGSGDSDVEKMLCDDGVNRERQ